MFVCFDVHTALNQRFPSVLCAHTFDSFVFFSYFALYSYTCIDIYIHIYITESVRGLTKEREKEKVKKKSNTSTAKPRSRSLLYTYASLPRLTSSSSLSFVYSTQEKFVINYFDRVQMFMLNRRSEMCVINS